VAVFLVNHGVLRRCANEDLVFIREAAERTRTATERQGAEEARREETDAFVHVVDLDYRWLAINREGAVGFERVFGI
jgi:hypothetical protein